MRRPGNSNPMIDRVTTKKTRIPRNTRPRGGAPALDTSEGLEFSPNRFIYRNPGSRFSSEFYSARFAPVSQDFALRETKFHQIPPMRWLIALPLACILPGIVFLFRILRFGTDGAVQRSMEQFSFGILFLASLGATLIALAWYFRSEGRAQKIFTLVGYLLGIPVALITLAILPWFLPPLFASLFGGSLSLILCTFAGYDFGAKTNIH